MDGILLIKKEKGMTSRDVVNIVCQVCKTKKVGHTGTLDPMAEGLLIVCVGKATKLVEVLTSSRKTYVASMKFGVKTDTMDATGKILKEEDVMVSEEAIKQVLKELETTYEQEVPIYSAVKIHGKKLYEYARNQEEVTLPKRIVTIYQLLFLDYQNNILTVQTEVSKGTYIRSLVEDIARKLNTIATMTALTRTKIGMFSLEQASTIEEVRKGKFHCYSIYEILSKMYPVRRIHGVLLHKVENGAKIDYEEPLEKVFFVNEANEPVALYRKKEDQFVCDKMLKKERAI